MKKLNRIDLLAGAFIILMGGIAIIEALRFNLGTARSMGPGYFPLHVGILMMILGCGIIFVEGLRRPSNGQDSNGNTVVLPRVRSLLFITAGILGFTMLIERGGLVPAVAAAVFLSCLADREMKPLQIGILTVVIPTVCVVIFQWLLGLQVQAFRW